MRPGELVRYALESLNTDLDVFYEHLADDVTFEPFGIVGAEATRAWDRLLFDALSTHHRVVEGLIEDGDHVYVWLRFTGTTKEGTELEFETNNHYVVHDGKIASMRMYLASDALGDAFA